MKEEKGGGSRSYLALGSNLDNRQTNIIEAINRLSLIPEIVVVKRSSLYETEPVGYEDQHWFINAVIEISTILSPRRLLEVCLRIEDEMGRVRSIQKGPREIDIDILLYNELIVNEKDLKIPHPAMHERRFVLVPLFEIAPYIKHPILKRSIKELLVDVGERGRVNKLLSPCLP